MNIGVYVRCPIIVEPADEQFPRCFVFAQVKKYNELADAVEVEVHDLFGSKRYYPHAFAKTVFPVSEIDRCPAMRGAYFKSSHGKGRIVSRILGASGDEPYWYYVQLENGSYLRLSETQMQIEYSQMDYSPLKQMLGYEFQNPSWYANRIKASRNAHMIDNAAYGFKTLAGCRTFLLPHQISTISRCLEFAPIRYMLADEVGLGKTIEACGIIKIMLTENVNLRVLFILPGSLINQWKSELKYKFNVTIDGSLTKKIIPLEDLQFSTCLREEWDMIVIDETHRLLSMPVEYDSALKLSRASKNILLLSATPIQDRNEEYLKLLTLLSPDQYENMTLEQFAFLVKKQKSIQRNVNQQLKRMDRFDDYGPTIIEKLNEICDELNDDALKSILKNVDQTSDDGGKDVSEQALSYICENYRLERKVIRNRRELIRSKFAKRSFDEIPYLPASADEMYNETAAVESVLSYLSDNCDGSEQYILSTAQPLLCALSSSPWALQEQMEKLKIADISMQSCVDTWVEQAEQEIVNVDELMDDPELIKGRLLRVLDYIEQNTNITDSSDSKIVVFTAHNATLKKFLKLVNERLSEQDIYSVAFGIHMTRDELEDSVYEFQNDDNCRMIICDETGGEGRNFQNAEMIIHLDMPWNANALEQRIGRLDRLGRNHENDVLSVVVYTENTVEEQLFRIWRDGMKLFEQSLSGLEIITGELNKLITDALLDDFYNGLANAFNDIMESTEQMRESVLDEQLFDVGATIYRPLSQAITRMLTSYEGEEDNLFASSMLAWSCQAGLEAETPTRTGLVEFLESRFSPRAALQSLFVPPYWKGYNAFKIVKRENRIIGTFDRSVAIKREDVLFFAPGDSIYDSIISNALGCGRGRCCAISIEGTFNYSGFLFTYNVEPKLDDLIENSLNLQILSQFRMFLPLEQIVIYIPITQASANEPEDKVRFIMSESRRIESATHLGQRGEGRYQVTSPLEKFIEAYPADEWGDLVIKAERRAKEKAKSAFVENSDLQTAKREIKRIINGYRAECLYFGKDISDVENKQTAYKLAYEALIHSKLVLDSACFLRVVQRNG
jgi:ATP-dependent helicase HepA